MMKPNPNNFCGGAFQDWLEVNLTRHCNGRCSWCIEKDGYHPDKEASCEVIAQAAIDSGAEHIILLGGEPTLYKELEKMIRILHDAGLKVYITTNGSLLTPYFVKKNLKLLTGLNISIHDYDLYSNNSITGIFLYLHLLQSSIEELHKYNINVRLNCNCIKGYIDSKFKMEKYIYFAKMIGADKVRFAELKCDDNQFVNVAKVLNYEHGLTDDPFNQGCNINVPIFELPVNVRLMCGLHTIHRIKPENPEQHPKKVLYYDGKIYDGWKTKLGMKKKEVKEILAKLSDRLITLDEAYDLLKDHLKKSHAPATRTSDDGAGCYY